MSANMSIKPRILLNDLMFHNSSNPSRCVWVIFDGIAKSTQRALEVCAYLLRGVYQAFYLAIWEIRTDFYKTINIYFSMETT